MKWKQNNWILYLFHFSASSFACPLKTFSSAKKSTERKRKGRIVMYSAEICVSEKYMA